MNSEIIKLPCILKYSDSQNEINNQLKANKVKLEKIRKNEIKLINKRNIIIDNKVKKIDEDLNKMRKFQKYSFSNVSKIEQTIVTPCLSVAKNSSSKHQNLIDDNNDVTSNLIQYRLSTKPKNRLMKDFSKKSDKNFSNNENHESKKDYSNFNNVSFIDVFQPKSIVKKNQFNQIINNSSLDSINIEELSKERITLKPNKKKKRDILWKIDKKDPNYKKIENLKNYDNLVSNLVHVKQILSIKDKTDDQQSFFSKTELEGSFVQTTARNDGTTVNLLSRINNISNVNKYSNSEKTIKNKSLKKILTSNNIHNINLNNLSDNKESNQPSLLDKEIKPVVVDKFKQRLKKVYKLNSNYQEEINKVKHSKNLSLEEYQKRMIDVASKYISGESISNLSAKLNSLRGINKVDLKETEINNEEQLNELQLELEYAEMQDFKNLKEKKPKNKEIRIKKTYIKKRKIDENIKKVGHFLPTDLFEKLKAI